MLKMEYQTKEDIEYTLHDFKVYFAYHSNKIENNQTNYHDVRGIFEDGKIINFTGDVRTLYEIQSQKECYKYLLDKIVEKEKISIDLIKKIHEKLTYGTYDETRYEKGERPGEFKKGDYIVGVHEIGSLANEVEDDLLDLLEEINDESLDDYLTIVAYFHLRFESIHPFADGNGRVGRTLMNYYLMIHDIKPLIIYEEDKKIYYECLQAYDEKEDIEPLKKFLDYSQEKTWQKKKKVRKSNLKTFLV